MHMYANCSAVEVLNDNTTIFLNNFYQAGCNGSLLNISVNPSELDDSQLNKEQLLNKYMGPKRSTFFTPICTTYLFIFAVGAVGNTLTCTVIIKHRIMRTPTNYYLVSLAISDLLVLIFGMPLELYEMWSNYPFLFGLGGCYFKVLLLETVCFASVLNVTALSAERYIAVVHPLKAKYMVTRTHAKHVIIIIWVISVLSAIPNTSLHGIFYLKTVNGERIWESAFCMPVKPRWMYNLLIQITTVFFFFLPMGTISFLYLLIGLQLKKEKMLQVLDAKAGGDSDSFQCMRIQQEKQRRQQVTKMLFVLVVVFGICWAPFHTDRLMWSSINLWTAEMHQMFQCVHIISGVFFYLSSAVNPILYNLMSTRFREMFKEVMCHSRQKRSGSMKSSSSITRVTTHSTVCEHVANNDPPMMDLKDSEMYLELCKKDKDFISRGGVPMKYVIEK
ncbi:neuromedin-U receptor 1 [Protopterus annectens]|uniref:neuromedin-U receptor 1 n=1 Tax=Protopterus annectens TaxID=7888 RepID=UPI001CFA0DD1|nr:neuromedin-U receptor 1 [Protopterus annectens]